MCSAEGDLAEEGSAWRGGRGDGSWRMERIIVFSFLGGFLHGIEQKRIIALLR